MGKNVTPKIKYPQIGICGLSCRLCPRYHSTGKSKCDGCKTESRISAGCPFITCALKRKHIEFCHECHESVGCEKWRQHREQGKLRDSFKCYQKLEENILTLQLKGLKEYEKEQIIREELLRKLLLHHNEGRSKSYYCIVATVLEVEELKEALEKAEAITEGMTIKEKSKQMHVLLDMIAEEKNYLLILRK